MAERNVVKAITGKRTVDGAGVNLVRVLGIRDVKDFDPFLMLDSFDSVDPQDYIAGFPMHPHRGIETITYLIEGEIEHEDSLGNKGTIYSGQSQWMTAGSGILHQEMPKTSKRMLGAQFWLNLPQAEKTAAPKYFDITEKMIPKVKMDYGTVRVISGAFNGQSGAKPHHIQATLYDISLDADKEFVLDTKTDENVFIFLIDGDAFIGGEEYSNKTAILFGNGDTIRIKAPAQEETRFIYCSGKPLHEPVAWGGPIVMNTNEELNLAYKELETGTFIKHHQQ